MAGGRGHRGAVDRGKASWEGGHCCELLFDDVRLSIIHCELCLIQCGLALAELGLVPPEISGSNKVPHKKCLNTETSGKKLIIVKAYFFKILG